MKRTNTLLLATTLIIAVTLLGCGTGPGGCGGEPPVPRPIDVTFGTGQVDAPGATIIVNGEEYSEQAAVGENALVGIVKGGQAYLYHPALGPAELSDYNSRRAIGFFLARLAEGASATTEKPLRMLSARLAIGESRTLATGATVQRYDLATYLITNRKHRWLAVKSSAMDGPVFMRPRDRFITDFVQIIDEMVQVWRQGYIEDTESRLVLVGQEPVETYGSVIPILFSPLIILDFDLRESVDEAIRHDSDLFMRVNAIEFLTAIAEAYKQLTGLVPYECFDAVAVDAFVNVFQTFFVDVLSGDEQIRAQFQEALAEDFVVGLVGCGASTVTGGASEVVTTAMDILSALDWVIEDDMIATIDVMTTRAYDSVEGISLDENQAPVVDAGGDQTVVWPDNAVDLLARVSDDGLPTTSSLSGNWAVDSGSGTVAFGNPSSANTRATFAAPGIYVLSFTVFDGDKTGNDVVTITVLETDGCPDDPNKTSPGVCGCGVADTDSDSDGTPDCNDGCPNDPNKTAPGICGCGNAEIAGCGTPGSNLVVNGEFTSNADGWAQVNHDFANWMDTAGWDGNPGWFFVNDFPGGVPETSQLITHLVTGRTYRVSGYYFRHTANWPGEPFRVLVDNDELFGAAGEQGEWTFFSFTFVAQDTDALLRFRSQVTGDDGYGIDGIRVVAE